MYLLGASCVAVIFIRVYVHPFRVNLKIHEIFEMVLGFRSVTGNINDNTWEYLK